VPDQLQKDTPPVLSYRSWRDGRDAPTLPARMGGAVAAALLCSGTVQIACSRVGSKRFPSEPLLGVLNALVGQRFDQI
jgi:hypothetical protein